VVQASPEDNQLEQGVVSQHLAGGQPHSNTSSAQEQWGSKAARVFCDHLSACLQPTAADAKWECAQGCRASMIVQHQYQASCNRCDRGRMWGHNSMYCSRLSASGSSVVKADPNDFSAEPRPSNPCQLQSNHEQWMYSRQTSGSQGL
jgi:hypothetical protein